ncbi:amidohydrolase [Oribacterium sp. NK2B42]|uniref:amidohydrolase n=1 Tax=Oribacterium sp. NK2B42 TaxID=689781 RepID=UPI00040B6614|nr:amidohydrolase [Oribacterium sp. NK2B42]
MDEFKPYAEAIAVSDEKIIYVGSKDAAMKLKDDKTEVLDYGTNSVYPGFLEAHCHPGFAGNMMFGRAKLSEGKTPEDYLKILKEYVDNNRDKKNYVGSGWSDDLLYDLNAKQLDEICPDKPMINQSSSGHMMWVNTKAMEAFDINEDAVKQWGTECIHVDENGKPNGVLAEKPAIDLVKRVQPDLAQAKSELLGFQKYAFSNGYTGVYDAGYQLLTSHDPRAYRELDDEGKLKLYSYCGSFVNDNTDTPEEEMDRVAEEAKEYNGKHVKVIGAKVFADGVVEGHTAWMLDDYVDKPGYKGVRRFDDHEKMVRLVKAAAAHNMNVHIHSIGDGATKAWIDAIAEAQSETGNFDMRNALAHLQEVTPEDVKRMGEYNVMAVCGIMWAIKHPAGFAQEVAYVGEEKSYNAYPVKSIMDAGGVVANHSDYPVSPLFSAIQAFCYGVLKKLPSDPDDYIRNIDQALTRHEALKTLTSNVAYMWHEEDRMGSISIGKIANFVVMDKDFMHDDMSEIEKARCLATIVDGEEVYKA